MLEILAPCGTEEALTAAVNTGADAVYLGETRFSARKNASNFDNSQLSAAVRLCHANNVKVHLTLNTLLYDNELSELDEVICSVVKCGIDAVIVQDLGVMAAIKRIAPQLPLHASTQMTITSAAGAEAARKLGFTRAVLARELSFENIKNITHNTDIETEIFVHGALCVCLSGQCYMSAFFGGRSGNRGLCAQPCRLPFSADQRQNVLSLKDLTLTERLREIEAAGVRSAKIEGRMKRPEYVAAAVTACRAALSGDTPQLEALKSVFSRSGFTQGYFCDDYSNMQGVRTKDDVSASASVLSELKRLYDKPYKRFNVKFVVNAQKASPVICTAYCDGLTAEVCVAAPQLAINRAVTPSELEQRFAKLGGTAYTMDGFDCRLDDGITISASALNELRRNAIDALTEQIIERNTPSCPIM